MPRTLATRVGTQVADAWRALQRGGIVVYPTDTLYGLGARITEEPAVRRVYEVKGRPLSEPLTIAVSKVADIRRYAVETPLARRLYRFLPGPLTLVLERRPTVPGIVTGGQATVGVRVPRHEMAIGLLERSGALTSTSANLHGGPDPPTIESAQEAFGDRVDYYLADSSPLLGVASTLVDARGHAPEILRKGVLSESEIRSALLE